MPAVSVIIPVYKAEPYLRRCVDSILAQTFADFELILVDDGSPDGCPAICDEYAQKDSHIHVIHQPNGGAAIARNTGIDWVFANSDSQWLTFIDSDDWIHPRYLELYLSEANRDMVDICCCDYSRCYNTSPEGSLDYRKAAASVQDIEPDHPFTLLDGMWYFVHNEGGNLTAGKFFARHLFTDIRFPAGKLHEDEYATYKLLYIGGKIAYISLPLYYYYIRKDGCTGLASSKKGYKLKNLDSQMAVREQYAFFKDHCDALLTAFIASKYCIVLKGHLRHLRQASVSKEDEFHKQELRLKKELHYFRKKELRSFLKSHPEIKVQDCYMTFKIAWPVSSFFKYSLYRLRTEGLHGAAGIIKRKISRMTS